MLRRALDWVQGVVRKQPSTPEQHEQSAATVRQDRADAILAFRSDVRRLQQDIKDISDARDSTAVEKDRAGFDSRLAALEAELKQKQRELARLQGRV